MTEIISEETVGTSKASATRALADAIKKALEVVDPNHKVNVTVVLEDYKIQDGEHQIVVKVMIMDLTLEEEKSIQESKKELEERMDANQGLNEQMVSAFYARPVYDQTTPVNALEQRMDAMGNRSSAFDFDANQDNITIVAPQSFHDQLRAEYNAAQPTPQAGPTAPGLNFGAGTGSSDKDVA